MDLFPNAVWDNFSTELEAERTLIEVVIPEIDDKTNKYTFLHGLYTENFEIALFEEYLSYNPYVLFRFRQQQGIFWGVGQGLKCIDDFETLIEFAAADREQVQRVASPPVVVTGAEELYESISMKAGAMSYGGMSNPTDPDRVIVTPILQGQQLMPIEMKIQEIQKILIKLYL